MTTRADRGWLSEVLRPALVGGAFFGPVGQVGDVLLFGEDWSWRQTVVQSVSFAVGVALFSLVALRFSAAAREEADLRRAVSTGVLPEQADAEWSVSLLAERRRLHANRTVVPGLSGLATVLVAVVTLLPAGPGGRGWVLATGLALTSVLLAVRTRSRLRTVERLLAGLGAGPASRGESAHVGDRSSST